MKNVLCTIRSNFFIRRNKVKVFIRLREAERERERKYLNDKSIRLYVHTRIFICKTYFCKGTDTHVYTEETYIRDTKRRHACHLALHHVLLSLIRVSRTDARQLMMGRMVHPSIQPSIHPSIWPFFLRFTNTDVC